MQQFQLNRDGLRFSFCFILANHAMSHLMNKRSIWRAACVCRQQHTYRVCFDVASIFSYSRHIAHHQTNGNRRGDVVFACVNVH